MQHFCQIFQTVQRTKIIWNLPPFDNRFYTVFWKISSMSIHQKTWCWPGKRGDQNFFQCHHVPPILLYLPIYKRQIIGERVIVNKTKIEKWDTIQDKIMVDATHFVLMVLILPVITINTAKNVWYLVQAIFEH